MDKKAKKGFVLTEEFEKWADSYFTEDKFAQFLSLKEMLRGFYENTSYKYWSLGWFRGVFNLWCRKHGYQMNPPECMLSGVKGRCLDPLYPKKGECLVVLPSRPHEKEPSFIQWADDFFKDRLNEMVFKNEATEDFRSQTSKEDLTPQRFKKELKMWCDLRGYTFNPHDKRNDNNRILQFSNGVTSEMIFIKT